MNDIKPSEEEIRYNFAFGLVIQSLRKKGFSDKDLASFANKLKTDKWFTDWLLKTIRNK